MAGENLQLVKKGFLVGLGLILPIAISILFGSFLVRYSDSILRAQNYNQPTSTQTNSNPAESIIVTKFQGRREGDKISVTGSITNKGNTVIGSIQLEAEFFDDKGEFLFERSKYIEKKLIPNEKENFQIACGCEGKEIPDYKTITVRVVNAHNF